MFAGTDHHAQRRALALVVATSLLVAACSSSDDGSTAGRTAEPPDASITAVTIESTSEPSSSDTEPAPPSSPPTSDAAAIGMRRSAIPSRAPKTPVETINDLAVIAASDASPGVAILAGSTRPDPGTPFAATAHLVRADGPSFSVNTVVLDHADATESAAYGIGADGDRVVVAGTVLDTTGVPRAAIWQSRDRGATFAAAEIVADGAATALDVTFVSGRAIVAAIVATPLGSDIVTYLENADGWGVEQVTTDSIDPFVTGIVASGTTVLLAGGEVVDGEARGRIWRSDDSGTTFDTTVAGLGAYSAIGAPALTLDGFVATADGIGPDPTDLVTSTDGRTWRAIPLTLTGAAGDPAPVPEAGAGRVAVDGDGFAVGIQDLRVEVARVDADGNGTSVPAPELPNERFGTARPFVLDGRLAVVGSAERSFRLAVHDGDDTWTVVEDPRRPVGAVPASTELELVGDEVAALTRAYPAVRPVEGGITYGPIEQWGIRRDGSWRIANQDDIPLESDALAAAGARQIAIRSDDDPEDQRNGPIGGTRILTSDNGGPWVEGELILTGPGGDYLRDATATADSFVAVGNRSARSSTGSTVSTPAIVSEVDGAWTEEPTPPLEGEQVWLDRVVATNDGLVVATGGRLQSGRSTPVVLTRPPGAAWTLATLPTEAADVSIRSVSVDDTGVVIVTQEDRTWWRHRTTDGTTFVSTQIQIDDPARSRIVRAITAPDRTLLVGSVNTLGALELAVWELDPSGSTVRLRLDGVPPSLARSVDDAELLDDVLYVSGTDFGENVVWELDLTG